MVYYVKLENRLKNGTINCSTANVCLYHYKGCMPCKKYVGGTSFLKARGLYSGVTTLWHLYRTTATLLLLFCHGRLIQFHDHGIE